MASEKNLSAVFKDIANSIRSKKGTTGAIQPINMASEIDGIQTGGEKSTIYKALEARGTNWSASFYARTQSHFSSTNLFQSMTELSESDLPPSNNVVNMSQMFFGCTNLVAIPKLNTSKVTGMNYMFGVCSKLITIPELNTSNVTSMNGMFSQCSSLTTIPELDTNKVTNMNAMFYDCRSLTAIPQLDTSNVTSMNVMFYFCQKLTTIPELDTGNVTDMSAMFDGCTSLKTIYMKNIKANLDISSTALQHDALVELINNGLATITTTQTLTMGSSKLALLSDSEKQVALDKGWTLA